MMAGCGDGRNNSPHVCILTSVHSPFDTRIYEKQARSLVRAGYRVTLVAAGAEDGARGGVAIRGVPREQSRLRRMTLTSWRIYRAAVSLRGDVYHFHDPELLPVGVALRLRKARVVYDAHEDVPRDLLGRLPLPRPLAWLVAAAVGFGQKLMAWSMDRVIVAREDIAASFARVSSPVVVSNYPILELFDGARRTERRDTVVRVIYCGGLTKERGIAEVVQAMQRVPSNPPAEMDFYGKTSPPMYQQTLQALPGATRCHFWGWVEYAKIPLLLQSADIGIVCFLPIPNNINAGPTKLFEYMAAGLPVVASRFPLWQAVLERHRCGICVDPTDPAEIADAIARLAANPELRKQMGQNGRAAVEQHYNWGHEAERLTALYEGLLRPNR